MTAREIFKIKKEKESIKTAFNDWFRCKREQLNIKPCDYKRVVGGIPGRSPLIIDYILNDAAANKLLSCVKGMFFKGRCKSKIGNTYNVGRRAKNKEYRKSDCKYYDDCLNEIAFKDIRKMGCDGCSKYIKKDLRAAIDLTSGLRINDYCRI